MKSPNIHVNVNTAKIAKVAVALCVYFVVRQLSCAIANVGGAPVINPATGISLMLLYYYGPLVFPFVFIADFGASATFGFSSSPQIIASFFQALGPAIGAWLLKKMTREEVFFDSLRDTLLFLACGCLAASICGIGVVIMLSLNGLLGNLVSTWIVFLAGNGVGIFITAPLFKTWQTRVTKLSSEQIIKNFCIISATVGISLLIFSAKYSKQGDGNQTILLLLMPLLTWSAIGLGNFSFSLSATLISAIAIFCTIYNVGPFGQSFLMNDSAAPLELFLAIITGTGFVLHAVSRQRQIAEELLLASHNALQSEHQNLEGKFRENTKKFEWSNLNLSRAMHRSQQLEEQLAKNEKSKNMNIVVLGMAQDFSNLVNVVRQNTEQAVQHQKDPVLRRHHQSTLTAAQKAVELCNQMMDFARHRINLAPLAPRQILDEITHFTNSRFPGHIKVKVESDEALPEILADFEPLRQIFINILTNAREAIGDQNGEVIVSVKKHYVSKEKLKKIPANENLSEGDYVVIQVRDSGCGMDNQTLKRIFEPFFSTKGKSRGLGLSAALGIVRAHKGIILVESTPGQGSRFALLFRACPTETNDSDRIDAIQSRKHRETNAVMAGVSTEGLEMNLS